MLNELISTPGVREELALAAPVGVMALHGGLEAGTAEAARRVADSVGASRYAIVQPEDLFWHIPSIRHDPAHSRRLRRFLAHVAFAVSFHGYGRKEHHDTVLLGGRNRVMAEAIGAAITGRSRLRVVTDLDQIPPKLRGVHPANPVNLPPRGGVQVELSTGARTPPHLASVTSAVASVLAAFA